MKQENITNLGYILSAEKQASVESPKVESRGKNRFALVLDTLRIGNSIQYYFLLFLPLFIGFSLLSLKGLKTFYQSYPEVDFSIPLLIWLLFFLQLGMNLARFISDFFVVKKQGKIEFSKGVLQVNGKVVNIDQTKKITFHYKGDEFWKFPSGILVLFALSKRHSNWLYTNPKELYDYVEIDGEVHYVRIKNASDRDTFFDLSKWINEQKPRLAFLIKER